jgi:hypothetical protein
MKYKPTITSETKNQDKFPNNFKIIFIKTPTQS